MAGNRHVNGTLPTIEVCAFCKQEAVRERAIREGWEPCYWDRTKGVEVNQSVCTECVKTKLKHNEEYGDFETI